MLDITERARAELYDRLHDILLRNQASARESGSAMGFRLVAADRPSENRELGLVVDEMRPGDEVVAHRGRPLLMLEGSTARLLRHYILDVVDNGRSRSLRITREH